MSQNAQGNILKGVAFFYILIVERRFNCMKYVFIVALVLGLTALIVWNTIEIIKSVKARVKEKKEKKDANPKGLDKKESERKEK